MKILLIFLLSMSCAFAFGQSTLPLRADTVVVEKVGGNANFKIKNSTRDSVGGILTNIGGGATAFRKSRRLTDSTVLIGGDTVKISGSGGGVDEFDELNDVTITTPRNGEIPVYDSVTDKWINILPSTYNPVWFGAIGDSATDNTATFRKMLETVPDGAIIEFPGGDFLFTDTILINKSIIIRGAGKESIAPFYTIVNSPHKGGTNLYLNSATKNFFHIKSSGTNKNPVVAFRDLSLINTAGTTPTDGAGILINDNFVSHSIENITVRRFYNNIEIVSGHFININFCNIVAPIQDGIVLGNNIEPDGGGCTIQNNKIISGTHATSQARGVYLKGGGAVIITGNYFNAQATLDTATQFVYDIYGDFVDGPTSEINMTLNNFANYKVSAIRLNNTNSVSLPVLKISNSLITPLTGSEGVEAIYIKKFHNITIADITAQGYPYYAAYPVIKLDSVSNITIGSINRLGFGQDYTQTNSTDIKTIIKDVDGVLTTAGALIATGPLTVKDPDIQIWKDATPSFATAIGMRVPGGGNENDLIFSTYAGGGWLERMRISNSTGALLVNTTTTTGAEKVSVKGAIGLLTGIGTNRALKIQPIDLGVDNFGASIFTPNSGTNASAFLGVSPKGTGFSSTNRASISVLNSDLEMDAVNYEIGGFRAAGTQYVLGTGKSGTGSNLPMMIAAGWLSDNTTNNNQLRLETSGGVMINTDIDLGYRFRVNGTSHFNDTVNILSSSGASRRLLNINNSASGSFNTVRIAADNTPLIISTNSPTGFAEIRFKNNLDQHLGAVGARSVDKEMYIISDSAAIAFRTDALSTVKMYITKDGRVSVATNPLIPGSFPHRFFTDGSIGANKDSAALVNTITTQDVMVWDTVDNRFKRMKIADFPGGGGSGAAQYRTVSTVNTSGTLSTTTHWVRLDASGGNITLTLPAASTVFVSGQGITYKFKRVDNSGNTITIQRDGSDTIDGAGTSFSLVGLNDFQAIQCTSASSWELEN